MAADSALRVGQIKHHFLCDVERTPIKVLFKQLKSTKEGLTSEEGANRLQIFGPNKLDEKKVSKILKFLGFMWNPLSWVMEFAAIIAIGMDGSGKTPDWEVFMGIVALLVMNSTISFIEENNAGSAAAALMAGFSPKTKVIRDGKWSEQEAANLVPGVIICIKSGDCVPADARLLNGDPLMMDQSALTGECFLLKRYPGQVVFSGSTCKQGESVAVVVATGVHTFFGKAVNLVDNSNHVGRLEKVLTTICEFCICCVMIAIIIEIIVMCGIQHRNYTDGINNLLVLMIGGIPIAMPTVLSVTMAIGSHRLSEQGAITKRMTAIEEMAGMDVLCSDKTGTLTLNKPSIDRNRIEVFAEGVDKEHTILLAARASKTENQDAIDTAVVGMLADPMEARAGIREVHFLPVNTVDRRTALTYIDSNGNWHRASKGSPTQIMNLCNSKEDVREKVRAVDEKFAKHGLLSLAVARQEVPERTKESAGAPWQFVGLLPLYDPPRHDSAETIRRALNLGVNVKMITGDQLPIAKETGRRLGMGTNMYPTCDWLNNGYREPLVEIPFIHLIEKADGFAVVFPDQKYEIVRQLQQRKHICGMTGDGLNDAPALKKANIGIAVAGASDAAINASDIILTEPGLSVIISAIMTSRAIFQRMKNYTIYAVSLTIRTILGFLLIALIWKFDFSPFMVLIIAILNDGTIMTIPRDRVKPSPMPNNWKLREIFVTAVVLGSYLALMTVIFFWAMIDTDFFSDKFGVRSLRKEPHEMMAALYLQVSIVGQALILVTRSRSWSCAERPGLLLASGFIAAQLKTLPYGVRVMSFNLLFKASLYALYAVCGSIGLEKKGTLLTTSPIGISMAATLIAVYSNWGFARIKGVGWGWAGVIWLYSLVSYLPLDLIKFFVLDALNGKAPDVSKGKTAFTSKKDYGREERAIQCPLCKRTLHGLDPLETTNLFADKNNYLVQAESAEQAKRPVEVVQGFTSCTQGNVESVVEPRGPDTNWQLYNMIKYKKGSP